MFKICGLCKSHTFSFYIFSQKCTVFEKKNGIKADCVACANFQEESAYTEYFCWGWEKKFSWLILKGFVHIKSIRATSKELLALNNDGDGRV